MKQFIFWLAIYFIALYIAKLIDKIAKKSKLNHHRVAIYIMLFFGVIAAALINFLLPQHTFYELGHLTGNLVLAPIFFIILFLKIRRWLLDKWFQKSRMQ